MLHTVLDIGARTSRGTGALGISASIVTAQVFVGVQFTLALQIPTLPTLLVNLQTLVTFQIGLVRQVLCNNDND